ncbi:hypothetical protein CN918_28825 [Priestia megaterium]|nr:hypothetical protein CN918_28825 [Priestia megaterium]
MSYLYNYLSQRISDETFMMHWSREETKILQYVHTLQGAGLTTEAAEKQAVFHLEKNYKYTKNQTQPAKNVPSKREFLLLA